MGVTKIKVFGNGTNQTTIYESRRTLMISYVYKESVIIKSFFLTITQIS